MKSLNIIFLSLLGFLACYAQAPMTKEEIRSELDRYSAEDNQSLVARIKTAQPSERKQIVDAIVEIAKEEAERVTLPFRGGGVDDPEAVRSRGTLLNAGHVLGQAAEENAILEAFGESYRKIEPETRAGLARTLASCKDLRALNLVDESARDAVEKLLSFDMINLSENEKSIAELYAGSLILSLEAMATSVNPAGEGKAHAILVELEKRSVGRPLMDKLIFAIKAEFKANSVLQINADEPSDSLDGRAAATQEDQAIPKIDENRSTTWGFIPTVWRVSSMPKVAVVVMIVAVLGLLLLLLKKRK